MEFKMRTLVSLLVLFIFTVLLSTQAFAAKKPYIVYLGAHSSNTTDEVAVNSHHELLGSILKSKEKAKDAIYYSYTKEINGFAANMDEHEANELSMHPSVVSVFPSQTLKLHTTHTWQFLGLERGDSSEIPDSSLWKKARFGEDVIIGTIDTGVWPESKSFRDDGMGPIPSRWKGICDNGSDETFNCNKKLIGARYFYKGYLARSQNFSGDIIKSPRDNIGHGSHTLSTAAGAFVTNASYFGYANGTAKGGSPRARVAAYKVCYTNGCDESDVLAAFEKAIHDRVDVLSLSLGGMQRGYFEDSLAIGAFHAVMKGITVVCSAGNDGPFPGSVTNVAPWILTVGASTVDREFPSFLLYNRTRVMGASYSDSCLDQKLYPMINSVDAHAKNATKNDARYCLVGTLDPKKVKGKIVVCLIGENDRIQKGLVVKNAGGAGMVLTNDVLYGDEPIPDPHFLPAINIGYSDADKLYSYLNSTKYPKGYISCGKTSLGKKIAPVIAEFSSLGPNIINQEIIKPDITAPGVDILAAYPEVANPTEEQSNTRRTSYALLSGTSMSCPHVAGLVGLLKTLNPDWSPAMIKSAIMTTATTLNNRMQSITDSSSETATPFSYGSGHVKSSSLTDPGLVYDITPKDYFNFLCSFGYNKTVMNLFTDEYSCPSKPMKFEDLNYPSISIPLLNSTITVTRTVTNVGPPGKYKAIVSDPKGASVTVEPSELEFEKFGEEKSFEVSMEVNADEPFSGFSFGKLEWTDGIRHVRSPLVVYI
ncbi:Tripeptidyl-peptidase II protein [Dioscorea alata]|uniref:Tripeptidyl-peptidase II protein n=1 Tax=Dioscorea alata TaxID=55571 RepID=A0ACB7W954_DIOAL|nr:Tripeptidyl-peptidase II protein [Dioscorea alata]